MSLYICPVSRTLKSLLIEGMSHFDVIRIFISLQTGCWIYREWLTSKKQFVCSHHACILVMKLAFIHAHGAQCSSGKTICHVRPIISYRV